MLHVGISKGRFGYGIGDGLAWRVGIESEGRGGGWEGLGSLRGWVLFVEEEEGGIGVKGGGGGGEREGLKSNSAQNSRGRCSYPWTLYELFAVGLGESKDIALE